MSTDRRTQSLSYAVRPRVVAKYLGLLLAVSGILTLAQLGVSLWFGETDAVMRYVPVVGGLIGAGWMLARLPVRGPIQGNEAMLVGALTFLLVPLIMAYPMSTHGIPFVDALFETLSAITTTGLTTLREVERQEQGFLFARAWMQWYGGLGIVVLTAALLAAPGTAARRLTRVGSDTEDLVAGTHMHARRILSVYLVLTGIGVAALWLSGLDAYPALLHGLAGISTGGFSSYDGNMAAFGNWGAQAVLIAMSVAGAVSLALYHPSYFRTWSKLTGQPELRGLFAVAVVMILLLGACMGLAGGFSTAEVLHHAPLMALSAQTGAGFSSLDVASLDPASKLVLIVSMFIGGSVGSTAGGIKIIRLLILLRLLQLLLRRTCLPPHAVAEPQIGGHRLQDREIEHALLVILAFAGVVLLSWFAFLLGGYDPLDALFDVVSATATVGLSSGVAAADLPDLLKGVLCLNMLLGRLEIVALLLVLYPRTWIGRRLD